MNKLFVFALLFIVCYSNSIAQSSILSDKFIQNPLVSNPAFTGVRTGLHMTAIVGNQFNNTSRPSRVASVFMIEQAFYKKVFESDSAKQIYYEKKQLRELEKERLDESGLEVDKTYDTPNYKEVNKINLSFTGYNGLGSASTSTGIGFGLSYRTDLNGANLYSGVSLGFNYIPVAIGGLNNSFQFLPSLNLGFLYAKENYFAGISAPNLFSSQDAFGIVPPRSFNVQFGYSNQSDALSIEPLIQIAYNSFKQLTTEAYLNFWLQNKLAFGGGVYKYVGGTALIARGEYQITKTTRVGVTFNPKPFGFNNTSGFRNTGLLNAMVKFNINKKEENLFGRF